MDAANFVDTSQDKNLDAEMKSAYVKLEAQAIEMLLSGDHAVLEQLRLQWQRSRVKSRMYSGTGFFSEFAVPEDVLRTSPANFELGDVDAWVSGAPVGMLLFVREGIIAWLEVFTYQEPWPNVPVIERLAFHDKNGESCESRDAASLSGLLAARQEF